MARWRNALVGLAIGVPAIVAACSSDELLQATRRTFTSAEPVAKPLSFALDPTTENRNQCAERTIGADVQTEKQSWSTAKRSSTDPGFKQTKEKLVRYSMFVLDRKSRRQRSQVDCVFNETDEAVPFMRAAFDPDARQKLAAARLPALMGFDVSISCFLFEDLSFTCNIIVKCTPTSYVARAPNTQGGPASTPSSGTQLRSDVIVLKWHCDNGCDLFNLDPGIGYDCNGNDFPTGGGTSTPAQATLLCGTPAAFLDSIKCVLSSNTPTKDLVWSFGALRGLQLIEGPPTPGDTIWAGKMVQTGDVKVEFKYVGGSNTVEWRTASVTVPRRTNIANAQGWGWDPSTNLQHLSAGSEAFDPCLWFVPYSYMGFAVPYNCNETGRIDHPFNVPQDQLGIDHGFAIGSIYHGPNAHWHFVETNNIYLVNVAVVVPKFRYGSPQLLSQHVQLLPYSGSVAQILTCPDTFLKNIWQVNTECGGASNYAGLVDTAWIHEQEHGRILFQLARDTARFDLKRIWEAMTDTGYTALAARVTAKGVEIGNALWAATKTLDDTTFAGNLYAGSKSIANYNPAVPTWIYQTFHASYKSGRIP